MSIPIEELRAVRRIITHDSCPDGVASAMILHDALPNAAIEFVQYGQASRELLEVTEGMLFCDMTPPRERAQAFVDAGAIVLDHHEKQRDIVELFGERGVFGENAKRESGAWLAFDKVWLPSIEFIRETRHYADFVNAPMNVREFAMLAAIRDTWQTQHRFWTEAYGCAVHIMMPTMATCRCTDH